MNVRTNLIPKNIAKFSPAPHVKDYAKTYKEFSWKKAEKLVDFFEDGTLNIAYNAVDRHAAGAKKDKAAILFVTVDGQQKRLTYGQLKDQTSQFANVLVNNDVKKGDRVFIFLPTIPQRYVAFLGILKMGAVAGTLFSAFQEIALTDRLKDSQAKVVVTDAGLYPRIEKIWKNLPDLKTVIIVDKPADKLPKNPKVLAYSKEMKGAKKVFAPVHMQRDDYAYMLYTSGTTGKPKGVVHAHFDILQALVTTKYVLDLHDNDTYWCTADLGWVTGVVYGVLGPFGLGVTNVIYEGRFSPEAWYGVLQDTKATIWYTAPTAIRMLMGANVNPQDYKLGSIRHLYSVGEPLNPQAIWWGLEAFGLAFHDTWWQTELGAISITNFPALPVKPGSMGKPLPGVVAAILDDNGRLLPANEEGNLVLRADTVPSLMKTIWNNQAKYDSYFRDGWYISGDRAYRDEDGYFWFVGRADDVINTSGERIGPFEVESALVAYDLVVEAGVIGKPDAVRGEIIKAFVVVKPGTEQTEALKEELKAHVKKNLAGHSYPREIEFIDKLPKTRSGKIMRRVLKAKELGLDIGDTSTLEEY